MKVVGRRTLVEVLDPRMPDEELREACLAKVEAWRRRIREVELMRLIERCYEFRPNPEPDGADLLRRL